MVKQHVLKVGLVAFLAVALISVSSTANAAVSKTYKNCGDLKKKYPNGVAVNRMSVGNMAIDVRPVIYKANKKLDLDRDGIACEDEALQLAQSTTTTAATTTTTSTIPVAPSAPSGLALNVRSPFDGTALLSWADNSSNEDNFYVSSVDPVKLVNVPLSSIWYKGIKNQTSMTATGLMSGYTYCFWVMAVNTFGLSPWSAPICSLAGTATTTSTAYVPPTVPYIPSFGGGSSSSSNWLGCYFKGQKMWGNVYISSSSWSADFSVYVSSSSWSADLKVYQPTSSWSATSCGMWYITTSSWNADFSIYLTSSSWSADFSIYLTNSSWSAGR